MPLGAVDAAHAIDEGKGYQTVSDWRLVYKDFCYRPDLWAAMHDSTFTVSDSTEAVLMRFVCPSSAELPPRVGRTECTLKGRPAAAGPL